MRRLQSIMVLLLLLATGCGGGLSHPGTTDVTIALGKKGLPKILFAAVPPAISQVRFTISGPEMETIVETIAVASGQTVTRRFEVPNGADRLFFVEAIDAGGTILHEGRTQTDLDGTPVTLAILLAVKTLAATPTFLFYRSSLSAVIPGDPVTTIPVAAGATSSESALFHGTLNLITRVVTDLHPQTVIYEKGGSLYKVSALRTGDLAPVPVSGESGASVICEHRGDFDLADHANARWLYRLPGADASCFTGDDIWKMIRVGMTAADPPLPAFTPVESIYNPLTVALTGWLGTDGGVLYRYDADFLNPISLTSFQSGVANLAESGTSIFLKIDNEIRTYESLTGILSGPLYTFANPLSATAGTWGRDGTDLYFIDGSAVYRLPLDGSGSAAPVSSMGSGAIISLRLTDNAVMILWQDPPAPAPSLLAIPKTGGPAVTLRGYSPTGFLSVLTTAGGWIYYNDIGSGGDMAVAVMEDGTGQTEYPNALWAGSSVRTEVGPFGSESFVQRVLLAEGIDPLTGRLSGGTITSYDAATHTPVALLGTPPADILGIAFGGFGSDLLGVGYDTSENQDLFYLDTERAGSLRRVTATPTLNETPIF